MDTTTSKLWTGRYLAIVAMAFLFFLCIQLLTAGFPAYITDLKNNPTQAGLMTTAFMIAAIITRPVVGYLIHKLNMTYLNIIGLVFVAITVGLSFGQQSIGILITLRILHGIGFGILSTIISTMATNIIPTNRLGEGIGYYGLATSAGTSLAPMLALFLLQYYSYNFLIIISVLLTITTLLISIFVKSPRKNATLSVREKVSFKKFAFDKKALLPCMLTVFFTISLGGVISFLRELGREAGIGGSTSLFFLVLSVMMIIIRPLSGRIFDRYGHKLIIYTGTTSAIIGLFLLSITQNLLTLLLAGVFYGIAYGVITPTLQAIAVKSVTKEKQGTANGMFFSGMDLGMAIGSTGLGVLASYTGYHFIYGFSIIFLIGLLTVYTFVFPKKDSKEISAVKAS